MAIEVDLVRPIDLRLAGVNVAFKTSSLLILAGLLRLGARDVGVALETWSTRK